MERPCSSEPGKSQRLGAINGQTHSWEINGCQIFVILLECIIVSGLLELK